jgi:hypothetical protein
MPKYRVYSVNPNGQIHGDRFVSAADDEDAIFAVKSMQRPDNTEIWLQDRRIAKIPGTQS